MNELVACMGGWCRTREACANYHAPNRSEPAERLCKSGQDGVSKDIRIEVYPSLEVNIQQPEELKE